MSCKFHCKCPHGLVPLPPLSGGFAFLTSLTHVCPIIDTPAIGFRGVAPSSSSPLCPSSCLSPPYSTLHLMNRGMSDLAQERKDSLSLQIDVQRERYFSKNKGPSERMPNLSCDFNKGANLIIGSTCAVYYPALATRVKRAFIPERINYRMTAWDIFPCPFASHGTEFKVPKSFCCQL